MSRSKASIVCPSSPAMKSRLSTGTPISLASSTRRRIRAGIVVPIHSSLGLWIHALNPHGQSSHPSDRTQRLKLLACERVGVGLNRDLSVALHGEVLVYRAEQTLQQARRQD